MLDNPVAPQSVHQIRREDIVAEEVVEEVEVAPEAAPEPEPVAEPEPVVEPEPEAEPGKEELLEDATGEEGMSRELT
ncbi:hypothetical protein CRUP_003170 [Coryphaenoides rupestris]|nr:hypothetical protein CRUP_003170 [Coryphaenoides rupestris]